MDIKFALQDWASLNATLKMCNEKDADALLKAEIKGKARNQFLVRIYSRFNKQRALRERKELAQKVKQ
jgi:hypothetical protein